MAREEAGSSAGKFSERIEDVLSAITDLIFVFDAEGRFVFCHGPSEELYAAPEEFLGKRYPEVMPPHIAEPVANALEKNRKGEVAELEYSIKIGGRNRWYSAKLSPTFEGDEFTGSVAVARDVTKQKLAERAIQESAEEYRLLVENLHEGVWVIDNDAYTTFVNPRMAEMLGYTIEEVLGRQLFEFMDDEGIETCKRNLERRKQGIKESHDFEFITKEGKRVYALLETAPITSKDGTYLGAIAGVMDITERKRTEKALEAAHDRFRELVETTSDWVWEIDADGIYTYASPKVRDLLGYEPEEVLGMSPFELMPPGEAERLAAQFGSIMRSQQPFERLENTNVHKDGHLVVLETSGTPIFDAAGVFRGYRGVDRDVTDRKRMDAAQRKAEEALKESEQRFRAVFERANDGIVWAEIETRQFTMANETFCKMLGYDQAEIEGLNVTDIHPEEDLPRVSADFEKQAKGELDVARDLPVKRKDGSVFYADVNASPLSLGGKTYLMGIFRDSTARKATEENLKKTAVELVRSNRELEQFAHTVSHDLHEPLRSVAGFLRLLDEQYRDKLDDKAQGFVAHALGGAERMQALIDALLSYSRVGRGTEDIKPIDCAVLVQQVLADLRVAIEESGAEVSHEDLPTIVADETQLTQLFQNLISNAVKFRGQDPPRIHITAQREPERRIPSARGPRAREVWRFSVVDNGIGIDREVIHRVFDAFERGRNKRAYPGTGIGLAICKRVVQRHGGRIWAESEPGKGTTFHFTLPASQSIG